MSEPTYLIVRNRVNRKRPYYIVYDKRKRNFFICADRTKVGVVVGKTYRTIRNWFLELKKDETIINKRFVEKGQFIIYEDPEFIPSSYSEIATFK